MLHPIFVQNVRAIPLPLLFMLKFLAELKIIIFVENIANYDRDYRR